MRINAFQYFLVCLLFVLFWLIFSTIFVLCVITGRSRRENGARLVNQSSQQHLVSNHPFSRVCHGVRMIVQQQQNAVCVCVCDNLALIGAIVFIQQQERKNNLQNFCVVFAKSHFSLGFSFFCCQNFQCVRFEQLIIHYLENSRCILDGFG